MNKLSRYAFTEDLFLKNNYMQIQPRWPQTTWKNKAGKFKYTKYKDSEYVKICLYLIHSVYLLV